MNFHIYIEVQQLKVHLQRYPEQSAQLAMAHLEDYLIVLNECQRLEKQIELLRQDQTALISLDNFINMAIRDGEENMRTSPLSPSLAINAQLTLEQQWRVEVLKRNLASEPNHNQAKFWAMTYFKHFLHKSEFYLEKRAELISLKKQPSLPHFL